MTGSAGCPRGTNAESTAVAGLGAAPSGLDPTILWLESPVRMNEPTEDPTRLTRWLADVAAAGVTRFVVPKEVAGWLVDNPEAADALVAAFPVLAADRQGIVFDLTAVDGTPAAGVSDPAASSTVGTVGQDEGLTLNSGDSEGGSIGAVHENDEALVRVSVDGWSVDPEHPYLLCADSDLTSPHLVVTFAEPLAGAVRGEVAIVARGIETLRLRCRFDKGESADAFVDLADPSFVHHTLDFFEVAADPERGIYHMEFDLAMPRWQRLSSLSIEVAETRNWRFHPDFPGGRFFRLRPTAPAGASLEVIDIAVEPATATRSNPSWQGATNWAPAKRPPKADRRDAVVFSSWVPERALPLAEYFVGVLRRYHAESRIFVGINHDSTPRWRDLLEASGLDVEVRDVPATMALTSDAVGTIAALSAYRESQEPFDLVWFGHTKGISKLDEDGYGRARWAIQRWFWGQRDAVEAVFQDPAIGVWAPHWLMFQREHRAQADALRRMYDAPCAPLGAMAVSTHYAVRDACVRAFVDDVQPGLFTRGPAPFGGDRFFGEFAMPNIPIMQGYEPFVPEGEGGTSGEAAAGNRKAILNDWRQNNAMVRHELARWRQDPVGFEPIPVIHTRRD